MNATELREAVRARTNEAARKCIWQKAHGVAVKYGKPKFEVRRQAYYGALVDALTYTLETSIGERRLEIRKVVHQIFPVESLQILIDNSMVFHAHEVENDPDHYKYSTLRNFWEIATVSVRLNTVGYTKESRIYIITYQPGEWERWLCWDTIRKALEEERRRRDQEARVAVARHEAEALKRERTRPLNEEEIDLARRYGIAL